MFKKIKWAVCLFLFSATLFGQAKIQTPDEFLPHKLGEQFTEHNMLVNYFQHVASISNRVKLVEFGKTNEKRPMLMAIVSSPENLGRLEEIRLNNLRNTGMAPGQPDNSKPVTIVWLGFSVHGNEAAGSESSMAVLFELTNPANTETQEWLKNTVVLMEPSSNPDGYTRYTSWYRSISPALPDPNPIAKEHREPWPGGRSNHYLFDLNRDWAWATQIESQHRLKIYQQWMPHVAADLHEQSYTSPYYFAPAAQPYHAYLTKWQSDFQVQIGKNHAKYFDKNGWLYFTKERFDLLYPSYGDTYPSFNGSIGMTYEQGGSSRAGRAISLPNGDTLMLFDRMIHHKTAALSTVEVSSKNAASLVQNFNDYFKKSQTSPPGKFKTFIIRGNNPAHKIQALTSLLDKHAIKYGLSGKSEKSVDAFDYQTGKDSKISVVENDLIISAYQPKGLLTQVLFEPSAELVDSMTYDITAWALPYAYGLESFATTQRIEATKPFEARVWMTPSIEFTPYAFLAKWNSLQSARFLGELLKKNVVVRFAEKAFSIRDESYPAGTLVITHADNRKMKDFAQIVLDASGKYQLDAIPVSSGFVSAGNDFGSGSMIMIEKPKVLLLGGERTFSTGFGQAWFFFDKELEYPVTIIDADQTGSINLNDFNVMVLPEGFYRFSDDAMDKIGAWIDGGGKLIALGEANRALEDKKGFSLTKFAKSSDKDEAKKLDEKIELDQRTAVYNDRERDALSNDIPGAIVQVRMDKTHPLAFGLLGQYASLKTGMVDFNPTEMNIPMHQYASLKTNNLRYDLLKNAWNVGYLSNEFNVYGFMGSKIRENLKNSAVFSVQNKGRGSVVYLIDNPLFRNFWEEGKLLFSNAVFLVN